MKREIRRPHWKQIAKRAKRKVAELKKELHEKQPAQTLIHKARGEAIHERVEGELKTERKMTKAQQRWYSEGFETAQSSYRRMLDSARAENERHARAAAQRRERRELLEPLLQFINKLLED